VFWGKAKGPDTALANNGDPITAGAATTATATTSLLMNVAGNGFIVGNASGVALRADQGSNNQVAIVAKSDPNIAIQALSTNLYGVQGLSDVGTGIYGQAPRGTGGFFTAGGSGVAANSTGNGAGVYATSAANNGVYGEAFAAGSGVYGRSSTGVGVFGISSSFGVQGQSTTSYGVAGFSPNSNGVYGETTSGSAIYGKVTTAGPPDIPPTGFAGYFQGDVHIVGAFTATGIKSAVVPVGDGTGRQLYCLEAPDSWFEDFGQDALSGGSRPVAIDKEFLKVVDTGNADYMVFITPLAPTPGLFVASRSQEGFVVQEVPGGSGTTPFCYRVVAKRADVEKQAVRLRKVDLNGQHTNSNQPDVKNTPAPSRAPDITPLSPADVTRTIRDGR
jgi:hypothetical protein